MITLNNASKRFANNWIFKDLHCSFVQNEFYAIVGNNGTGKSTLLQIIAGYQLLTTGNIQWSINEKNIEPDKLFAYVAMASPFLGLLDEFTIEEFFAFHFSIKPPNGTSIKSMLQEMLLYEKRKTYIKHCSSGMKQRVKLAIAFYTDSPFLLLDEPTSNLDEQGKLLYHSLINKYTKNRITIIASNEPSEFTFCKHIIDLNLPHV